jgi:hypothetical protein
MAEQLVLVWQKNRGPARIHKDEQCPTLAQSRVSGPPPRSVEFAGKGTAGWLRLDEAMRLPDAAVCRRCM